MLISLLHAGVRNNTTIEDLDSADRQVHLKLVVLAVIQSSGHHRPRFSPPAAAAFFHNRRRRDRQASRSSRSTQSGRRECVTTAVYIRRDDYWTPQLNLQSSASPVPNAHQRHSTATHSCMPGATGSKKAATDDGKGISIDLTAPLLMAILSAGVAGYNREEKRRKLQEMKVHAKWVYRIDEKCNFEYIQNCRPTQSAV